MAKLLIDVRRVRVGCFTCGECPFIFHGLDDSFCRAFATRGRLAKLVHCKTRRGTKKLWPNWKRCPDCLAAEKRAKEKP